LQPKLQILHLEDNAKDAELVRETLLAGGIECQVKRVETAGDFESSLKQGGWNLILSDYKLPAFDGMTALSMAKKISPEVPFIMISGTIGEVLTVEALKLGASDFVLKDHLSPRLELAVRKAMDEALAKKEHAKLEEQMRQAQKMEAVGQLAGGIAHDFNNLLTVINGYSQMRLPSLAADDPVKADLEQILKAGKRAEWLVKQLLAFSRKQIFQPKVINLNDLIQDMDKMFKRLIPENIEFVVLASPDLWAIQVDPDSFHQVLTNLVVNASHAMPQGGKVVIETKNVVLDTNYAERSVVHPGEYLLLAVSDTGTGMTDEVKAHLFEPFFTTKEKGKGTGLGLSTIYGIVKQCGGTIQVYSEVGHGTTFKIYVPRVHAEAQAWFDSENTGPLPRGTETVLIVEDDDAVRAFGAGVLRKQGYEVLEVSGGEQALRLAGEYRRPIQVLLTDMVMHGMGGKELADKLKTLRPGIRVIMASGYTENISIQSGKLGKDEVFLQKPFSPRALAHKIREVLDRSENVT